MFDLLTMHAEQDTQLLEALWCKLSIWDFDIMSLEVCHNPFHARDVFRELGVISLVPLLDLFYSVLLYYQRFVGGSTTYHMYAHIQGPVR